MNPVIQYKVRKEVQKEMTKKQKRIVACGCLGAAAVTMSALFMTKDMWGSSLFGSTSKVEVADTKVSTDTAEGVQAPIKVKATKEKKVSKDGMTIHFQWTSKDGEFPHLYYDNINGKKKTNMTNPGVPMNKEADGWYSYTIPDAESADIMISVPEKDYQTTLQEKKGDDWYFAAGGWYTENPDPSSKSEEAVEADNAQVAATNDTIKVYCYSENETPNVYYWNALPNDKEVDWPGAQMEEEGNNWYSYTFEKTSKINVLFLIGDTQTDDFTAKKGNWWYTGAEWTQSDASSTPKPATPKPTRNPNITVTNNDFREESIYFVMTTRFFDGDPSNNVHCEHDAEVGNGDDDPAWRGDFKGLIEKLDYIKALGFSAVWVTPVVENASGYDYHGYHALDFRKIDPRYESSDTSYQDLIDACHERGMKLIQDVVFNHTSSYGEQGLCDIIDQEYVLDKGVGGNSVTRKVSNANLLDKYVSRVCTEQSNKNGIGQIPSYSSYSEVPEGEDYTGAVQYNTRTYALRDDGNKMYRDMESCTSFGWEEFTVTLGQFAGDCQEINTENPAVYNYLVGAYNDYISMGVDAFRVDTVKHISRLTFNEAILPPIIEHAKSLGNDNFYMFGEVCSRVNDVFQRNNACVSPFYYTWKEEKDYGWNHSSEDGFDNRALTKQLYEDTPRENNSYNRTTDNAILKDNTYREPDHSENNGLSVIDYTMHFNFENASQAFRYGQEEDKYVNDSTYSVMYVDSHDYGPAMNGDDSARYSGGTEAWAENLDLIFTFRGIPCIYYGSEIEFKKGLKIDNYNEALENTGRAYFGDHIEGSVTTTDFGVYSNATGEMATTLNSTLAKHIQKLNLIRRAVPALQKGQYTTEGCNGGMSYKRRYTDGDVDSYVLVAISSGATFTDVVKGTYVDLVTGKEIDASSGTLSTGDIGKANMRVFVLQNQTAADYGATGKIGESLEYLK